jgi:hypothetical protein
MNQEVTVVVATRDMCPMLATSTKRIESPTFNAQGMLRCIVFNFNPPSKFPLMMWPPCTRVILCVTYGVPKIGGRGNNNLTFGDGCVALVSSITCKDELARLCE